MSGIRKILTVVLVACAVVAVPPVGAQIEGITLGIAIKQLLDKLGSVMLAAQNAGNHLVVAAGGQVQSAILMAKTAYEDSLNTTADRFTQEQRKLLDDLSTKVGYLERDATKELKDIVSQGALAVNVIPFSKTFPQLASYSPTFLHPAPEVFVGMRGNFFDIAKEGYAPELQIDNLKLKPISYNTRELMFSIQGIAPKADQVTYRTGKLKVPYQKTCFLFFSCRESANFDVLLLALPSSAGTLTFTPSAPTPYTDVKDKESRLFKQESFKDDIPDPRAHGFQHCEQPDPGWYIDTSSVAPSMKHAEGDWQNNGNTSSLSSACWNFTTVHKGVGTSGKIHFTLKFKQKKDSMALRPLQPSILKFDWGVTKLFEVPPTGQWKAVFNQFDGKVVEINSPAFDNPYLGVQTSGNMVLFRSIP